MRGLHYLNTLTSLITMVVLPFSWVHRSIVGEGICGGAAPAKWLNRATVDEMTQIRALEMRKLTLDTWRCSAVKMVHGNEIHLADTVVVLRKGTSKLA
jgi:hypothetical protein